MPRVSSFYGITIWIYYDEIHHSGRPHFHAGYGKAEAAIDIENSPRSPANYHRGRSAW